MWQPGVHGRRQAEAHEVSGSPRHEDLARVAQLGAEEAFRLLQHKHNHDGQNARSRFETELNKRTAEIDQHHRALEIQRVRVELEDKLRSEKSDKADLNRRVEDYFREMYCELCLRGDGAFVEDSPYRSSMLLRFRLLASRGGDLSPRNLQRI